MNYWIPDDLKTQLISQEEMAHKLISTSNGIYRIEYDDGSWEEYFKMFGRWSIGDSFYVKNNGIPSGLI